MTTGHSEETAGVALVGAGIEAVTKKVLISPHDGWDGWVMRLFELGPGGHTPHHSHDWPHINVVLRGEGILRLDAGDVAVRAGSYAFVPAGDRHQFLNAGDDDFAFICIVPEEGEG